MIRAALYLRVSTATKLRPSPDSAFEQNRAVQEHPLRQLARQRGWTISRVYSDRASGARDDRPGLKSRMADARRGEFDLVLVWRFDRFAGSVEQLGMALAEFRAPGIGFVSHQEALENLGDAERHQHLDDTPGPRYGRQTDIEKLPVCVGAQRR